MGNPQSSLPLSQAWNRRRVSMMLEVNIGIVGNRDRKRETQTLTNQHLGLQYDGSPLRVGDSQQVLVSFVV
jgi:hypothetical protein